MTLDVQTLADQIEEVSHQHGEPYTLLDRRLEALQLMADQKMPTIPRYHFEDWPLLSDQPLAFEDSDPHLAEGLLDSDPDVIRIVQVGQTTTEVQLPEGLRQQGVILTDIFSAARIHPRLIEHFFMNRVVKPGENKMTAAHLAFLNAGVFLYVPKGVEIDTPIEAEIIQDATKDQPLNSHLLIVAEAQSKIHFLQHLQTVGERSVPANMMVEIVAQEGSNVAFSSLDELGPNTHVYFKRRANIGRDAHVEWAVGLMNDGNTLGDMDSELIGQGGYADAKAIAVTTGSQLMAVNNRVTNRGKKTTGLINQRGVLLEKSELIFNGIGQIVHGAHGAKADQQNRVLMMSGDA
ncbi:MAG: SufD family Fe-S cluster assembly protein, partial [Limosilactobacillus fermentum]